MERSNSFAGKRSFINTAYSNDPMEFAELRKSKIQNLPNFKKINLGDNMPFVVVFQTIEIERLSAEIESNRVKIKDFERQIFNAQNYEVQIRQLTEKCFALQMERGKLMEEIEKLNLISQQLYTELEEMKRRYAEVDLTLRDKFEMERGRNAELMQQIERWKARYMAAEKSKDRELEDLRQMMQSQRKSMIDREIRELTLRFQTDRGNLQNEIRKLRQGIEYKNRELDEFRQRCQKYQISMVQLRKSETIVADLNGKINIMNQEISRLNDLLRQKQDQIEIGRQKQYKLQQQLKQQQQWEFENKQLRGNLENRTRQIEDWRIKCGRLEDEVAKGRELGLINQQLSSRLEMAGRKIDELNSNLRGKVEEVQQWKQRLARQEAETNKYKNLEVELRNHEGKIGSLTSQIDRLNNVIRSRIGDVEDWKNKCSKLQMTVNNYAVMERNHKELQDKIQDQTRNSEQLKNRINRYEIEINNLRNVERRLQDTDRKNSVLNNQMDRLNNLLRSKTQEVEDAKTRTGKMEATLSQYRNIEVKMQEHEGTIAMLTQQLERLNNILRNKNDQYERLANRCRGLEDQVNFLKAHETKLADNQRVIQNLNVTINQFKRSIQTEQERYRGLEGKLRDFQSNLYNLNQERDKTNSQLKQKSFEFDDLRNKYSRMEQEMYHLKEVENEHREAMNKIRALMGEQQRLERVARQMSEQLEYERKLSNDLGCKVIILSAEIERNSGNTGIKSKEFLEMKENFYRLQKSCRDKDNEIMILTQKAVSIEKQLIFVTGELEKYLGLVTAHERKAKQLEKEIIQYEDYAKRIMILSAEIDRISGENRGLEDDIRKLRLRYADNIAQQKKHQDLCMSFVMLFVEIESLRSRLADREVSIEQMRKSVLEPVRNIK